MDLSLDRIRRLAGHLPAYTRTTCHIAGTNGKGSVCAILSSIFHSSGFSVGRFNSPHLLDPHDSISVNQQPVSPETYNETREKIENISRVHGITVTSFELLTLTALQVFEATQVDIVILEVGMGGRLDATNVIPDASVLVSALTSVDLDHQAFLGSSVEAIAAEKAAIARPGRPFVLGPQKHPGVGAVVQGICAAVGSVIVESIRPTRRQWDVLVDVQAPSEFAVRTSQADLQSLYQPIRIRLPAFQEDLQAVLPLLGDHQIDNLGVALTILSTAMDYSALDLRKRMSVQSIANGIRSTSWPGRLSFHNLQFEGSEISILADGAHNAASAETLARFIARLISDLLNPTQTFSLTYILALSHSPPKTPSETLEPLLHLQDLDVSVDINVAALTFSPPEGMPWVKPVPREEIEVTVKRVLPSANVWVPHGMSGADSALFQTLKWAVQQRKSQECGLIVLAGSLYLVADFYREFIGHYN